MRPLFFTSLAVLASIAYADTVVCNSTQSCPESEPCCNQYGECGTGSYCLGGCHPAFSYDINACVAMPICKSINTTFDDASNVLSMSSYLGDAEDADWIYSGYLEDYNGAKLLAMPNQTDGTVVSSTRYVWYGRVGAEFKTSRGGGVVSAFILFSNAQDEIDWEFVGSNLTYGESNFYFQGELNYTNMIAIEESDTFENYHLYEVDWTEDRIEWLLDDEVVRTLKKEDTWNETEQIYKYPQTPARVQFSIWPAGDSGAVGTIEWSGGAVDWGSTDMEEYGYFFATLKSVSIECYGPPAGTLVSGSNAYVFNDTTDFGQDNIMITNNSTILCDIDSSGLDTNKCSSSSSSSVSSKSSSTSGTSTKTTTGKTATTAMTTGTDTGTQTTTSVVATGFIQSVGGHSSTNVGVVLSTSVLSVLLSALSYLII